MRYLFFYWSTSNLPSIFKFCMHSSPRLFSVTWHTPSWFLPCMLLTKVSHFKALCCGVSKWRLFVCQSIRGLYKASQNNPMMTIFLEKEMTLKTTLLVWELMVKSNVMVSFVIGPNEKFWSSMTLISTNVLFFTRANLYCHTKSLSMKHANALESKNVWASIVKSLLYLIMIGTKKHGARPEDKLRPFSLHDASRSNLTILTKTKHVCFLIPLVVDW